LEPEEQVLAASRPRWLASELLAALAGISFCLLLYALLVEPGFVQLLSLPACPVLGTLVANLVLRPVAFVTDRRIVFANRFHRPLARRLDRLEAVHVGRPRLGRLLRFGTLFMAFRPEAEGLPPGAREGLTLERLPDPEGLAAVAVGQARRLGVDLEERKAGRR
jgi:hypothetical protein